jgi:hypothetical protein
MAAPVACTEKIDERCWGEKIQHLAEGHRPQRENLTLKKMCENMEIKMGQKRSGWIGASAGPLETTGH